MSIICGIYYYNGRAVTAETSEAIMRKPDIYCTDVTGIWQEGQVLLGCHSRHITPESVGEKLPYHDELSGLTITADAIIDNRNELYEKLAISYPRRGMPDSQLILHSYQKWGQDCPKHLLGDFAFSIWDERRQELFCAVDHTGTRTFYYHQTAGFFAFSTLIRPLISLPEIAREYDEFWIADFLAMTSVMHQLDPELTLYKNIYLLPAGHSLLVRPGKISKQVFWQVEQQPELKLKSDGEYEEAFRDVFSNAVSCRLRSIRPVAVMLSGGLDSASVACMAARELARNNQRLLAFSAVPMSGYRDWLPAGSLADETPYIEAVRQHAGNIDVNYCKVAGKHSLSDTERLLTILEQPYKVFENLLWIDGIMAAAQKRNVGVILTGSAGNVTISWGDYPFYLLSLLREGRWYQLLYESWAIARRCRSPQKALFILFLKLMPYNVQKILNRLRDRDWDKKLQDLTPINPDFACRAQVQERFRRFGYDPLFINRMDSLEARKHHLRPDLFSHLGVFTTKHALAYKMALRDPTMDKRLIEFCLSLPENQYVRSGRNRFLLRRAMTGILPDKIRKNETERGRQSADLIQRLQPYWPDLSAEISSIGHGGSERTYLDIEKIRRELSKYSSLTDEAANDSTLIMLLRSLIFSRFLRHEESS